MHLGFFRPDSKLYLSGIEICEAIHEEVAPACSKLYLSGIEISEIREATIMEVTDSKLYLSGIEILTSLPLMTCLSISKLYLSGIEMKEAERDLFNKQLQIVP